MEGASITRLWKINFLSRDEDGRLFLNGCPNIYWSTNCIRRGHFHLSKTDILADTGKEVR